MKVKLLKKIRRQYNLRFIGGQWRAYNYRAGYVKYYPHIEAFLINYVSEYMGFISLVDYAEKMIMRGRMKPINIFR